jgi:dolichol-phosphate mannosyltransferase
MRLHGVAEVIVVDDQSSDGTADIARAFGASVVAGTPLPSQWAGKAWALQQGVESATGDWVMTLDADTRPSPELATAAIERARGASTDLLTVAGRFDCPTRGSRWMHPALLTTLVYRFGAPGDGHRQLANGQCMVFRREPFLERGGMSPVAGALVEDVALARHITASGGKVAMIDGSGLLEVRMFESLRDTWRGWGRSIGLPGINAPLERVVDAATIVLAQGLPIVRSVVRRPDVLDVALLLARVGTLAGTAHVYSRRGPAYWLSPLADPAAAGRLLWSTIRPSRTWRGRSYP